MTKHQISTVLLFLLTLHSSCKLYKLPDAKLKPQVVCGYEVCEPGNMGLVFQFYKKPFSPDIDSSSSGREIAESIIGHTFPTGNDLGDRAFTCSYTSTNPFAKTDVVNLVNPTGKNISYRRIEKLNIDVKAAVEGNLEEIKRLNPAATNLPEIEAKLTASYSKMADKELVVQAKYSEWGLSRKAIEKLAKEDEYTDCKHYLIDANYRIITAISLIYFDITFEEKSMDQIAADLESEIKKYGVTANISASFKREVNKSLKSTLKGGYQIISWRHTGMETLTKPRSDEKSRGYRMGLAMGTLVRSIEQFYATNNRYPVNLDEVKVQDLISILKKENLDYSTNAQTGYSLRFAGQDDKLNTSDDKVYPKGN